MHDGSYNQYDSYLACSDLDLTDPKVNYTVVMSLDVHRSAAENEFTRALEILFDSENGAHTLWKEHVGAFEEGRACAV